MLLLFGLLRLHFVLYFITFLKCNYIDNIIIKEFNILLIIWINKYHSLIKFYVND